MNIFKYLDYREAIEKVVEEAKEQGLAINISKLAEKIRIQKTYVSRVLRKQAHFSADQIYLCALALGLSQEETDYLILLMEYDRTALKDRKKTLWARIQEKQTEKRKIQDFTSGKMIESSKDENYLHYYLDPRMAVVYTYLMIPEYARDLQKIRDVTAISNEQFRFILSTLEQLKLIEKSVDQKSYRVTVNHIHLPKESPLSFPAEQLIRSAAFEHMKRLPKDKRFFYSLTFAADEATRAFLHDEFLKFINTAEKQIRPAPSEEAFHMAFDLFPWTAS